MKIKILCRKGYYSAYQTIRLVSCCQLLLLKDKSLAFDGKETNILLASRMSGLSGSKSLTNWSAAQMLKLKQFVTFIYTKLYKNILFIFCNLYKQYLILILVGILWVEESEIYFIWTKKNSILIKKTGAAFKVLHALCMSVVGKREMHRKVKLFVSVLPSLMVTNSGYWRKKH